jgi:peptide/nickel transport system substrate-binding protein
MDAGAELGGTAITRRQLLEYSVGAVGLMSVGGFGAACNSGSAVSSGGASSGAPKRGGTIKVAFGNFYSTDSLDPAKNVSLLGLVVSGILNETLVQLDENWNASPMLATDWTVSKDLKTYTFKLRKDVQFSSGKTLGANDVVWSYQHVLDPKTGSPGLSIYQPVLKPNGVVAVSPDTVQFNLVQPDAFFLVRAGGYWGRISQADSTFNSASAGTGPFISTSFSPGQGFQLRRNPNYWGSGLPYLDNINGVVIAESATKVESVLTGDVDLSDSPDFSSLPQFANSSTASIHKGVFGLMPTFSINEKASPFTNLDVRRAMKMLVDRKKYAEVVAFSAATVSADTSINPKDPFYPPDLEPLPYDPEQAKALLKKAGYSSGFKATIWATPALPGSVPGATLLKSFWAAGNVDLSVESLDLNEWAKHEPSEAVVTDVWLRQHPATIFPFVITSKASWQPTALHNPQLDSWVAQAQRTTDVTLQKELYSKVQHTYNDQSSTIWPADYFDLWPYKNRVQNIVQDPTRIIDFAQLSVTS